MGKKVMFTILNSQCVTIDANFKISAYEYINIDGVIDVEVCNKYSIELAYGKLFTLDEIMTSVVEVLEEKHGELEVLHEPLRYENDDEEKD